MGRPYPSELKRVSATIAWALQEDVSALRNTLLRELGGHNLVAIGSGGSLVAASFAALLHEAVTGRLARSATPLEAVSRPPPRDTAALLLSARGTNTDIRRAAEVLPGLGYEAIAAVTARKGSPLSRILKRYRAPAHEFVVPGGRDGFLATNSLIATLVLLYRAALPADSSSGSDEIYLAESRPAIIGSRATLDNRTLVVLAHGWATPAAVDFESRFSEGALANVSVTDPRNFAHGRHHWLSLHAEDTGIVSLETQESAREAKRMLRYLPEDTDVLRVTSTHDGPAATIELVRAAMEFAGSAGVARGVDPGRPFIAEFGRRLYRSQTRSSVAPWEATTVTRKRKALFLGTQSQDCALTLALRDFIRRLEDAPFTGLAIDYDGTLCGRDRRFDPLEADICKELVRLLRAGIVIGVASGRGRSVHKQLRAALNPQFWSQVVVGFYNGASVVDLNQDIPKPCGRMTASLEAAHSRIRPLETILGFQTHVRPHQVSLRPQSGPGPFELLSVATERLAGLDNLSLVASSHSVDIVPAETSKIAVVNHLSSKRKGCILRIGDQGAAGGNDFELLNSGISLSVDRISSNLETCWNLGPPGLVGPSLTVQYLRALNKTGSAFHFDISHLVDYRTNTR